MELLAENYHWLITALSVMAVGKMDKNGKIELRRLMQALRMMHSDATAQEVTAVCNIMQCFDGNSAVVYYNDFLQPIKQLFTSPEQEEEEKQNLMLEKEGKAIKLEEEQEPEQENVEEKKEVLEDEEQNPAEREEKQAAETTVVELEESWYNGDFRIVINRCHDCRLHETYTRHSEEVLATVLEI